MVRKERRGEFEEGDFESDTLASTAPSSVAHHREGKTEDEVIL